MGQWKFVDFCLSCLTTVKIYFCLRVYIQHWSRWRGGQSGFCSISCMGQCWSRFHHFGDVPSKMYAFFNSHCRGCIGMASLHIFLSCFSLGVIHSSELVGCPFLKAMGQGNMVPYVPRKRKPDHLYSSLSIHPLFQTTPLLCRDYLTEQLKETIPYHT